MVGEGKKAEEDIVGVVAVQRQRRPGIIYLTSAGLATSAPIFLIGVTCGLELASFVGFSTWLLIMAGTREERVCRRRRGNIRVGE